jgi:chromosome partitioning protein
VTPQTEYPRWRASAVSSASSTSSRPRALTDKLTVGGIVMTMYDAYQALPPGRRGSEDPLPRPRDGDDDPAHRIRLSECPSHGQTIFQYDVHSPGAVAYEALAKEFVARFGLK